MLTSALITLAKKQYPDWSREMIREFLNEIQKTVFTQNATNQMRIIDTTTGKDPLLTTNGSSLVYNINTTAGFPYNAWRVTKVFVTDEDNPEKVFLRDATPSTSAQVIFEDAISGQFYVRSYRFPTEITSESVQLEIPEGYHITHVFEGLTGLIEKARSGASDRWEKFEKLLLPEMVSKMSDNDNTALNNFTPYRGY